MRSSRLFLVPLLAGYAALVAAAEGSPPETAPPPGAERARTVAVPVRSQAFDIWEIAVDGNTLLSEVEVQAALEPFVGEQKKAGDVDAARVALEQLYKAHGYRTVSVSIPRQTIRDGMVVLQVTEGRVASLEVKDTQYSSIAQIRSEVPSLAEGEVPDFAQVEKELAFANRLPNRRVVPELTPGKQPGSIDVDLKVEDKLPVRLAAELNNRHSRDTSSLRLSTSAGYDNLFQRGHSLTLSVQTAPQRTDDGTVLLGLYRAPLGDGSWSLGATALKTSSKVSTLGGVDVLGRGSGFGLELSKQFGARAGGRLYPSVSAGVDYKKLRTATQIGPGSVLETPIEYVPFSLSYLQDLKLSRQELHNEVSLHFASPQIGSNTTELDLSGFGSRGQMLYLRTALDYRLELPADLEFGWRLHGQLGDQHLVSGEQLSAGGMDSVRGYLEAEALGDYGYVTAFELRGPSLPDYIGESRFARLLGELRPYVFYDFANVRYRGPFPDDSSPRSAVLSSVGAGFSIGLFDHVVGSLVWALPLQPGPATRDHDNRLLFRISAAL